MSENEGNIGAFVNSLKRNNKQIKADRAESIAEDAQMGFKREVEDLEMRIKRMKRAQDNLLDMSPDNADSLILGKNFDAALYIEKEMELGTNIRTAEIKLEIAKARFTYLFGDL